MHTINVRGPRGSSLAPLRASLRGPLFGPLAAAIPVRLHVRDLGAHISSSRFSATGTLGQRMRIATQIANAPTRIPANAERKMQAIRIKLLPMSLCGCKATPVTAASIAALSSAFKKALDMGNQLMASPGLLFASWLQRSPDPSLHFLNARLQTARNVWH